MGFFKWINLSFAVFFIVMLTLNVVNGEHIVSFNSTTSANVTTNETFYLTTNVNAKVLSANVTVEALQNQEGQYTAEFLLTTSNNAPEDMFIINNTVYVLEDQQKRLYMYHVNGSSLNTNITFDPTPSFEPDGVYSNDSYIWAVDNSYDKVYRYDMEGNYDSFNFSVTNGGDQLTGNNTHLFLLLSNNRNVTTYLHNGSFVRSWYSGFASATNLYYDQGFIYLGNGDNVTQKFYPNGTLEGSSFVVDGYGGMAANAQYFFVGKDNVGIGTSKINTYTQSLYPGNVNITMNGSTLYNYTGNMSSVVSLPINTTAVELFLTGNGNLPFTFAASEWGVIRFSNVSVNVTTKLDIVFNASVTGVIMTPTHTSNFSSNTFSYGSNELPDGTIRILFNENGQGNFTQFYEFVNTRDETVVDETNVLLLTSYDAVHFLQIKNYGNEPLKDAVVRVYQRKAGTSSLPYVLVTQRLTDSLGETYVILDSDVQTLIQVTKDGYLQDSYTFTPSVDVTNSYATPKKFNLEDDETLTLDPNFATFLTTFSNRSSPINGFAYSYNATTLSVTTGYRNQSGLGASLLDKDGWDRYPFVLTPNIDFSSTGNDNVTLYVYIDGSLWKSYLIVYVEDTTVDVFEPTGLDANLLKIVFGIGLIMVSACFGMLFKNSTAGYHIFMIGGVLSPIVSLSFLWLSIVCVLSYVFGSLFKNISVG